MTLAEMADEAVMIVADQFTFEDFRSGSECLHGVSDRRDTSAMMKHLIDTRAIHTVMTRHGYWSRGPE